MAETQRDNVGRRDEDIIRDANCKAHEERQDRVDKELAKQAGWFKASAASWAVAAVILGYVGSVIISKLNVIEGMLSDSRVTQMQHSEQIKTLDWRVTVIEKRHADFDSNAWKVRK